MAVPKGFKQLAEEVGAEVYCVVLETVTAPGDVTVTRMVLCLEFVDQREVLFSLMMTISPTLIPTRAVSNQR